MPESVRKQLKKELSCSHVFDCLYDLKSVDKRCYNYLNESSEPIGVDHLSDQFERDQSTIHRSLDRLMDCSMVEREKKTYSEGGYKFFYEARDPEEISSDMNDLLDDWYKTIDQLICEFESEFN